MIQHVVRFIRPEIIILVTILVTGCKSGHIQTNVKPANTTVADSAFSGYVPGKSLLAARDQAVLKGLRWMNEFLDDEKNFREIGLDTVYIFMELSATSANANIRKEAKVAANKFALRMQKHYLELNPAMLKHNKKKVELLDLLSEAKLLGLNPQPLKELAETVFNKKFSKNGSISRERKKEVTAYDELETLLKKSSETEVFYILMDAYSMEKADVAYPDNRFSLSLQLTDILRYLKNRPFVSHNEDKSENKELFYDHAFLATHIAYIFSNYGRLKLREQDAPWLYTYLRSNFHAVLAEEDVELVGEFIDVFRSLGFSEENDAMVRSGTLMLLRSQNPDGSWCNWQEFEFPYDAIHCAWCAVMGLRERTFLENTPYHRRIREILNQIN